MNRKTIIKSVAAILLIAEMAEARFGEGPEDWPCVQPYVGEISAAAFWSGELPEIRDWRSDAAMTQLADELSERATSYEHSSNKMQAFLKQLEGDSPEHKREQAALLVIALTDTINAKRARVLKGIERFAARQHMMITRMEEQDARIRAAQSGDKSMSVSSIADLETRQKWDIRVFEEREAQKNYLCEQTVLLEQRFFLLGREIVAWLGRTE